MDDEAEDNGGSGGSAAWMATFADMMTLLLTFFVLLLTFATMDIVKFKDALGSVKEAFGVQFVHEGDLEGVTSVPIQIFDAEENPTPGVIKDRALLQQLSEAISDEHLEDHVDATIDGRGVVLRINGQVLYQPGEAELRGEAAPILSRVANLVRGNEHRVMVEGHTDDVPIRTAQFRSNWELSTARAIAVMRFLVDNDVDASRVGVAGYAHLRPLEPNDTSEHRATNRRVEFVFVSSDVAG